LNRRVLQFSETVLIVLHLGILFEVMSRDLIQISEDKIRHPFRGLIESHNVLFRNRILTHGIDLLLKSAYLMSAHPGYPGGEGEFPS